LMHLQCDCDFGLAGGGIEPRLGSNRETSTLRNARKVPMQNNAPRLRISGRLAALPPVVRAERIETLQTLIAHAGFIDSGPRWKETISAYRDEIRQLQAA